MRIGPGIDEAEREPVAYNLYPIMKTSRSSIRTVLEQYVVTRVSGPC